MKMKMKMRRKKFETEE